MTALTQVRGQARTKRDRRARPERKRPGREPELQEATGPNPATLRSKLRKIDALVAAPGTPGAAAHAAALRLRELLHASDGVVGRAGAWRKCLRCTREFESTWARQSPVPQMLGEEFGLKKDV
jgi:hypothetical protein